MASMTRTLSHLLVALLLTAARPAFAQEVSIDIAECQYGWTAKYHRAENVITVRIRLQPQAGVPEATLSQLRRTWRDGIVQKWSNKLPCSPGQPNVQFNVQWVETGEHQLRCGRGRHDQT